MISLEHELNKLGKKKIKVDNRPLNGLYEPLDQDGNTSDERIRNLIELSNIHYNDALELVKSNNISKAMELLERSLEYNPGDKETLNLIGLCNYFLCNFDRAVLDWNRSIRSSSQENRAQYYLGFLKSKEFKGFMEYYNLAISYIDKFRYRDAIELLIEINKTNKELIEPYSIIGNCYFALGEYREARKYFLEALSRDKENVKYLKYLNKINEYSRETKVKKDNNLKYKIIIASMALVIAIGSVVFYINYNNRLDELEARLEPEAVLEESQEQSKKDQEADEETDLSNEEEVEEVEEAEEESETEDLNFDGSEFDILKDGMDAFEKGEYGESIDMFTYLVENASSEDIIAEATYYLAVSFQNEEEYNKAGEYYSRYIDEYWDKTYYDDSLYNYGLMLYENNKKDRAKTVLKKLKDVEDTIFMNSKVEAILDE